jgi:hypothetical protein
MMKAGVVQGARDEDAIIIDGGMQCGVSDMLGSALGAQGGALGDGLRVIGLPTAGSPCHELQSCAVAHTRTSANTSTNTSANTSGSGSREWMRAHGDTAHAASLQSREQSNIARSHHALHQGSHRGKHALQNGVNAVNALRLHNGPKVCYNAV